MSLNPWAGIDVGTLVDFELQQLAAQGLLIDQGYSANCVKQACYELRASNIVYEAASPDENKRKVMQGAPYILRPGTFATVIVIEHLSLPPFIMGRILMKGQLVSIGIQPVNTYADPGFQGRLGITLYNASQRYIAVTAGQPIAKIEFSRLPHPVQQPYAGQHGYETQIWPIPVHFYATDQALDDAGIVPTSEVEIERSNGPIVASMHSRLNYYERIVWIQVFLTIASFAMLYALYGHINLVSSVVLGVFANLLTTIGINMSRRFTRT